jgi:hypothetical protein
MKRLALVRPHARGEVHCALDSVCERDPLGRRAVQNTRKGEGQDAKDERYGLAERVVGLQSFSRVRTICAERHELERLVTLVASCPSAQRAAHPP